MEVKKNTNLLAGRDEVEAILVCNSNMFIPVVLSELLRHLDRRYLVISDIDNIKQFFDFLSLPNVVFYLYGFHPHADGRLSFIKEKRKLYDCVNQFSARQIVFFHAEFGEMANWLIWRMSSKIPIKYCKIYDSIPAPSAPFSLNKIKIQIGQLLYWGQRMDILKGSYLFPSLPESFFLKVNAETISLPVDNDLNKGYLKDKLSSFEIKGRIVLLTGTAVRDRWYKEDEYTFFINRLIETIGRCNVVSKCHPRYRDLFGLEKEIKQIPSFIPGNVLLDSFDYYIGVESTLLVEAASAGKISISLIDWLLPDEQMRQTQHKFFDSRLRGRGKIHFPQSMDELLCLLEEH